MSVMPTQKVLFYVDSGTMLGQACAAAEILRNKLNADVVMMLVDSYECFDDALKQYEIYDYASLLRPMSELEKVWDPSWTETIRRLAERRSLGVRVWRRLFDATRDFPVLPISLVVARLYWRRARRSRRSLWRRLFDATRDFPVLPTSLVVARLYWRRARRSRRVHIVDAIPRVHVWRRLFDATRDFPVLPISLVVARLYWRRARRPHRVHIVDAIPRVHIWRRLFDATWRGDFRVLLISLVVARLYWRRAQRYFANSWLRAQLSRAKKVLSDARRSPERFRDWYDWYLAERAIPGFLHVIRPDVIILLEDNIETLTRVFVARGKAMGVPSVIIPFTIPNPLEPAQFYQDDRRHRADRFAARTLTRLHPKWRYEYNGKALLRLSVKQAWLLELMGLSTDAPWVLNRGSATAIALDSEAQRDLYLDLGFPVEQLKLVGDANSGVLYEGLQNKQHFLDEIYRDLGLQVGRPLILCGFPPDQYSGTSIRQFEFANFERMTEGWMTSFRDLGDKVNVLVRPHPRLEPKFLARYEGPSVKISSLPTARLIPLCELYVASVSATIRWAVACGIPVINYDTYRLRYGDYRKADGVLTVERLDAFRTLLHRFVGDTAFARDLKAKQRRVMDHWGLVDNQFPERFASVVTRVIDDRARQSPFAAAQQFPTIAEI